MLVDSSAWIDFFNGKPTRQTDYLTRMRLRRRLLTADLVLVEVLQGFRDDRKFDHAREILSELEMVRVGGIDLAIHAAEHYRRLRVMGITIRKTIDTLLATACIRGGIPLLFADRDFEPFVRHLGLQSVLDPDPGVN